MRRAPRKRAFISIAVSVALAGALAATSWASELPSQVSTNWAGYAATTGPSTHAFARRFTSVSGSWTAPSATCVPGQPTFSAFWVGLGGFRQTSRSLEQVGTEADCSAAGAISYYAWYEYVPAGPHTIHAIPVTPGDSITASVAVRGKRATVTIADTTTGARYRHVKVMRSPHPDVGAAEWIAEAPSNCDRSNCTPLTLTDFGSVAFTNASATSVGRDGRHQGAIDDPAWTYGAINLQASPSGGLGLSHALRSAATVGILATTGDAFNVTYTGPGGEVGPPGGATGSSGTSGSSAPTGASGATGAVPTG
jgi:hypothetical protein